MGAKRKIHRYQYEWGGQQKMWWKRLGVTAGLVLVAGAVGWFAFDPVFSFLAKVGGERPPAAPQSVTEPESVPPESQSQAPAVTPAPVVQGLPDRVYYLGPDTVADSTRLAAGLQTIRELGGTGVMFDLKDDKGGVLYRSDLPQVASYLTQSETAYDLSAVLTAIRSAGLTPVGRLWTFQDSTVTSVAAMSEAAVKYMDSKVNWLDNAKSNGGKAWLNPNHQMARDYILSLVGEVTQKGVDCLVLDGVQFPTGFSLHLATYGGTPDRSAVLAGFLEAAKELHGKPVYPVLRLDAAAGINDIPYGAGPEKLAVAAGGAVLDVRPEQFGIGVTTERLTLTKPLLTPYDTVTAALAQATATTGLPDLTLGALVQCYTSARVESTVNMPYGAQEIDDQARAVSEAGIQPIFYYSPSGSYPQS